MSSANVYFFNIDKRTKASLINENNILSWHDCNIDYRGLWCRYLFSVIWRNPITLPASHESDLNKTENTISIFTWLCWGALYTEEGSNPVQVTFRLNSVKTPTGKEAKTGNRHPRHPLDNPLTPFSHLPDTLQTFSALSSVHHHDTSEKGSPRRPPVGLLSHQVGSPPGLPGRRRRTRTSRRRCRSHSRPLLSPGEHQHQQKYSKSWQWDWWFFCVNITSVSRRLFKAALRLKKESTLDWDWDWVLINTLELAGNEKAVTL